MPRNEVWATHICTSGYRGSDGTQYRARVVGTIGVGRGGAAAGYFFAALIEMIIAPPPAHPAVARGN